MRKRLIGWTATLLAIAAVAVCVIFFVRKNGSDRLIHGSVIKRSGSYMMPGDEAVLRVSVYNSTVVVELADAMGRATVLSRDAGAFSRWAIVVDGDRRIWYYSGDIGVSVFVLIDENAYEQQSVGASTPDLIRQMPTQFFEQLSSGKQGQWAQYR